MSFVGGWAKHVKLESDLSHASRWRQRFMQYLAQNMWWSAIYATCQFLKIRYLLLCTARTFCFANFYSILSHVSPLSKCALVAIANVTGLPVARCVVTARCKSLQAPVSSAHRQLSAVVTRTAYLAHDVTSCKFMRPCCEWIWDGNCFLMSFICFKLDGHN